MNTFFTLKYSTKPAKFTLSTQFICINKEQAEQLQQQKKQDIHYVEDPQNLSEAVELIQSELRPTIVIPDELQYHKIVSPLTHKAQIHCANKRYYASVVDAKTLANNLPEFNGLSIDKLIAKLEKTKSRVKKPIIINEIAKQLAWKVGLTMSRNDFEEYLLSLAHPAEVNILTIQSIINYHCNWRERETERMNNKFMFINDFEHTTHVEKGYSVKEQDIESHDTILLNWQMGSGKTQKGGKPFADYSIKNDADMIAITHRVSLVEELSKRLELKDYKKIESTNERTLALCVASIARKDIQETLYKIKNSAGEQYPKFVFIDEFEQVLNFLHSDLCSTKGKTKQDVMGAFFNLIQRAEKVMVADAGLSERALQVLTELRGQCHLISQKVTHDGEVNIYPTLSSQANSFSFDKIKSLSKQGPIWIATDGQGTGEQLEKHLKNTKKNILRVDAKTAGHLNQTTKPDPRVTAFLKDADNESLKYDVVIASPIISSGISIQTPHFKSVCVLSGGMSVPYYDLLQMMHRVRYINVFHVFLSGVKQVGIQQEEQILEAKSQIVDELDEYHKLEAMKEERENYGKSRLPYLISHHCEKIGYTVKFHQTVSTDSKDDIIKIRAKIKDADIKGILEAQDVETTDRATYYEKNRYRVRRAFNFVEDVTEQLIKDYNNGLHGKLTRLFLIYTDKKIEQYKEEQKFLKQVVKFSYDLSIDNKTAARYVQKVITRRLPLCELKLIPQVSKYSRKKDPVIADGKKVKEAKDILTHFGFKFKRTQEKGKNIYIIDDKAQNKMLERAIKHGEAFLKNEEN